MSTIVSKAMDRQTPAQIFLADQRGCSDTGFFRSEHTFNFGTYRAEGREPFGTLCLLNDDTLRAGASLTLRAEQPIDVVLLPLTGGLDYASGDAVDTLNEEEMHSLDPGQVAVLSLDAGMHYVVKNPYESETINCLQLWLNKPTSDFSEVVSQTDFDLSVANTLLPLFGESGRNRGFIGRYGGRQEEVYPTGPVPEEQVRRIFVFVIQGVFEVANRLLHARDGLSLTYDQAGEVEFEALSNDAMLILIDQPATLAN